jgi:hypothetical protein
LYIVNASVLDGLREEKVEKYYGLEKEKNVELSKRDLVTLHIPHAKDNARPEGKVAKLHLRQLSHSLQKEEERNRK